MSSWTFISILHLDSPEMSAYNPISAHSAPLADFQSFLQPFKVRSDDPTAYLPHSRPTWTTISMSKIQCQVLGQRIATNLIYLCLGDP